MGHAYERANDNIHACYQKGFGAVCGRSDARVISSTSRGTSQRTVVVYWYRTKLLRSASGKSPKRLRCYKDLPSNSIPRAMRFGHTQRAIFALATTRLGIYEGLWPCKS
ncbi:hypothetical protein CLAIMM_12557, partial [Cladophialophora immunda]